jgi:hypothetical protein
MNKLQTKNPFARVAYIYSGSPWVLWVNVLMQSFVALYLLFSRGTAALGFRVVGAIAATTALYQIGALIYYLAHRAQLAANPAKPIFSSWKQLIWIVAITLVVIAVFVILVLKVWHD